MRLSERPAFPAFAIGCVALADLAAGRILFRADSARVYFAGHPIDIQCAFRAATGLPCPTCGVTRSIVMSLHGEFARAWATAPAGPAAVVGLVAAAFAMLLLAWIQATGIETRIAQARAWIRRGGLAYAAASMVVWLAGWAVHFQAALASR